MILISDPADVIGKEVIHNGDRIGVVMRIKPNIDNGRRYAFVQPHDRAQLERRIPLDELDLVREV